MKLWLNRIFYDSNIEMGFSPKHNTRVKYCPFTNFSSMGLTTTIAIAVT